MRSSSETYHKTNQFICQVVRNRKGSGGLDFLFRNLDNIDLSLLVGYSLDGERRLDLTRDEFIDNRGYLNFRLPSIYELRGKRLRMMESKFMKAFRIYKRFWEAQGHLVKLYFITLTYRPSEIFDRKDIRVFLDRIEKYLVRKYGWGKGMLFLGLWRIELHKSGKPHYHYLLVVPDFVTIPYPDKKRPGQRKPLWEKGHSNMRVFYESEDDVEKVVERVARYVVKYEMKGEYWRSIEAEGEELPEEAKEFVRLVDYLHQNRMRAFGYTTNISRFAGFRSYYSLVRKVFSYYGVAFKLDVNRYFSEDRGFCLQVKGYYVNGISYQYKFKSWREIEIFSVNLLRQFRAEILERERLPDLFEPSERRYDTWIPIGDIDEKQIPF